jgi:hypothetical protein
MRLGAIIVAILLIVGGLIWTLQGANLLGGSFMSGQPTWLFIGIAVMICGLGLLGWQFRRGGPGR